MEDNYFKRTRLKLNINQTKMAKLLHISRAYANLIESNKKPISAKIMRKLDKLNEKPAETQINEDMLSYIIKQLTSVESLLNEILATSKCK